MQYEVETDDAIYEVEASSDEEARAKVRQHIDGATPEAPSAPSEKSNIQGFLEHNQLTAPFAHPSQLAADVSNYVGGREYDQPTTALEKALSSPAVSAVNPLANLTGIRLAKQLGSEMVTGASEASRRQFEKAWQDQSDMSLLGQVKGPVHAALGLLGAFPLTSGIATAAADLEEGKAGAPGEIVGELSNVLLPFLPKAAKGLGNKVGLSLEEGAVNRYTSAFNPKKRFEGLAQESARQSLERGIWGSEKGLSKLSEGQVKNLGAELEKIYGESPAKVDVGKATRPSLEELVSSEKFGGQQFNPALEKAAMELGTTLDQAGELPVGEAWKLRRTLEQPAVKKGSYLPGVDPALVAKAEAAQTAADALRPALAKAEPATAALNPEYNYYSNLKTLLANKKKTGQFGQFVRAAIGGALLDPILPGSGLTAAAITRLIEHIRNTSTFKTGTAVLQYKLAKSLQKGNIPGALQVYRQMGASPDELKVLQQYAEPDLSVYQEPSLAGSELDKSPVGASIFGDEIASNVLRDALNPLNHEPELIYLTGPNGDKLVLAAKKGARGASSFDPIDTAKNGNHELQSEKLSRRLGSDDWIQELMRRGYTPDEVVGFAHFGPNEARLDPGMVYVEPNLRRQGLATAMYDRARQEAGLPLGNGIQRPEGKAFRAAYDKKQPILSLTRRLYRGIPAGGEDLSPTGERYFTPDENVARSYAGPNGNVVYVDVPIKEYNSRTRNGWDYSRGEMPPGLIDASPISAVLPEHIAKQAKPWKK